LSPRFNPKRAPGSRKVQMPEFVAPQLATLVDEAPSGDEWLHELKFDGYRMLCHLNNGDVRFWTRNHNDWTPKLGRLIPAVKLIPVTNAIIDSEVVVLENGRPSFERLQRAMSMGPRAAFLLQAFDLIYLDGFSLIDTPLTERKGLLREVIDSIKEPGLVLYSDHIAGEGPAFLKQACKHGIEGIVSKTANGPYISGRTRSWLKIKCEQRQEFVIAGYIPSDKDLPGFGALVLGTYQDGELVYSGRVGTGFTFKQRLAIKEKLDRLARSSSPFSSLPKDPGLREAHWATPKLVGEVSFTEWTSDGVIRHPSFEGLREDKEAREVRRELPDRS
jgi:bifunctional non-homologous end joining protein LigD